VELIDLVSYIEKKEKCQGDAKTLNRIRQSTIKLGIVSSIRLNSNTPTFSHIQLTKYLFSTNWFLHLS